MFKTKRYFDTHALTYIVNSLAEDFESKLCAVNKLINADFLLLGVRNHGEATTLVALNQQKRIENFTYQLPGSPCDVVFEQDFCFYPANICELFPDDRLLQEMGIHSYLGCSIKNEAGENVGILAALFQHPIEDDTTLSIPFRMFVDYLTAFTQKCYLDKRTESHLDLLNEVQRISKTGAWEYQESSNTLFWSDEVYRIYGFQPTMELTLDKALEPIKAQYKADFRCGLRDVLESGKSYDAEIEITDTNNHTKWVRVTGVPQRDDDNKIVAVCGAFEDITETKHLLQLNEERSEHIENILNNINDAVLAIDNEGTIRHCNLAATRMFNYRQVEMIGKDITMLMPEPYASKHATYIKNYERTGRAKIIGKGRQLPAKRKNGDIFQMELSVTKIEEQGTTQYIGVVRDISERLEAADTIYNLAFTDNVTGLRNFQWFEQECKELMFRAFRNKHCIHALLLDIDKMAVLNTQIGFNKGDVALKQIADNLRNIIGNDYNIYKFDADAFVVLAKQTTPKASAYKFNASLIEQALLNQRNFCIEIDKVTRSLSASLGSTIVDPAKQSFESMLNILEHAVRNAKADAPFGLCHIADEGVDQYDRHLMIQNALKSVTQTNDLALVMQPQYRNGGKLNSFEALLRWNSAELGFVSPAVFIPLAEETGDIIAIGEWVLEESCRCISELLEMEMRTSVSVNISAKQIISPQFSHHVKMLLTKHNIPPSMLVLELTESALVADIIAVKDTMKELSKYGIRFSIDDFGTGYSSLAYLKELPIAELKIDKYFVDDITQQTSDERHAIVDAIINMAKAIGVSCVAEGVEIEEQYEYLKARGCDLYQGYYFSKPLALSDWRGLLGSAHDEQSNDYII